jgi:hypothetical protein
VIVEENLNRVFAVDVVNPMKSVLVRKFVQVVANLLMSVFVNKNLGRRYYP